MRHARFPDRCQCCGEQVELYYAGSDPHCAVCPGCGWSWPPEDEPRADPVDGRPTPGHYEGDGEVTCERALRSMTWLSTLPPMQLWWWGCAFKYIWRWPWKNGADDLRKAHDCIGRLLKEAGE